MPHRTIAASATCLVLCTTLLHPAPVPAADAAGNYAVWGIGQASCNQFVNAMVGGDSEKFGHYLAGYLTAINTMKTGVYRIGEGASTGDSLAALKAYCADHRMDSFERAIQALLQATTDSPTGSGAQAPAAWGRPRPAP